MTAHALQLADASSALVSERTCALFDYLRSMREASEAQRQVMLAYLGQTAVASTAPAFAPAVRTEAARESAPSARGAVARKAARTTRPPKPAATPSADMSTLDALVLIVSERTGYPKEMLDQDLDMEADLGIDSIKRIEVLGQLRDRLGLGGMSQGARSDALEELARMKTMRKIAEWLDARAAKAVSDVPPAPESDVRQLRPEGGERVEVATIGRVA